MIETPAHPCVVYQRYWVARRAVIKLGAADEETAYAAQHAVHVAYIAALAAKGEADRITRDWVVQQ